MNHDPLPTYDDLSKGLEVNRPLVEKTLSRFRVEFCRSENQADKFTPNHTRFDVKLYLDSELFYQTDYQCNEDFSPFSGTNVLKNVADDAMSYVNCSDLADFLDEFGYAEGGKDEIRKGIKAFAGCKETYDALVRHGILPSAMSDFFAFLEDNEVEDEVETEEFDNFDE